MGPEKRVRHSAADEHSVHFAEQVVDHFNLVRDFRAAQNRDEGFGWRSENASEILKLFLHQQPGRGLADVMSDSFGGSMCAVGCTEGVVDIEAVGERRELLSKCAVVLFFFRVKA